MNKRYPLEALLRPPIEFYTAVSAAGGAFIAGVAPWALMMTPAIGMATALILSGVALLRFRQGWFIFRYQRSLRVLPEYRLSAAQIPVSHKSLFLGRGFQWTPLHTQRLRDTQRPKVRHYLEQGLCYRWARNLEHKHEHSVVLKPLFKLFKLQSRFNPFKALPPVGGKPQIHAVGITEQPVLMDLRERVGHTLVLGTTRVGKTRLAELLITQDIRRGDVVVVFDPKGDIALMQRVIAEARRAGRETGLLVFHLGFPELSCRYNAIGNFSRITEVATRVTNPLPDQGNSAAFKEFAWRFTNMIAMALVKMGRRPDYQQITRYITNIEPLLVEYYRQWLPEVAPPSWEGEVQSLSKSIKERDLPTALKNRSHDAIALVRYAKAQGFYDGVADGLRSAFEYDKTYFDKIVASLLPLMEKLISGKVAELISPNYADLGDKRPILDWRQVIRRKGIVYIGLDALTDAAVAGAVGNSMFADLVSVAGDIYKHGTDPGLPGDFKTKTLPTVSLHADEFNELIGEEFIPLLNKTGGAGFQMTAYTQTWSDVEAKLGNKAKAEQVAGNFNTLVMLRVKELATAEMLTSQIDTCDISALMEVSGVNDSSDPFSEVDFSSSNEDRLSTTEVSLISPATIMALPKGQAFALLEGGQLWKIRLPLPEAGNDPLIPKDIEAISAYLQARYNRSL
ncbi:MAG: type IV conjugative transfer system coupling protein TraD [Methylococcales bacterium]